MKSYILLVFLIPLLICVHVDQDTDYTILDIDKCYGQVEIKVRPTIKNINDYNIKNCVFENSLWICQCNEYSSTPIILSSTSTTDNKYNILMQYFIKSLTTNNITNENNKRIKHYNNIRVTKPILEIKDNKGNIDVGILLFILIVGVILIIAGGLVIFFIYKKIKNDDDKELSVDEFNKISNKYKKRYKEDDELSDEHNDQC